MRKRSLRFSLLLSLLALAALGLLLYFPVRSYLAAAKAKVVEGIEHALQNNLTFEVGRSRISLNHGVGLKLYDLVVREKEGEKREIFTAQSFFVGLDVPSLLRGEIRILKLSAFRPRLIFTRDVSGKLNVEGLFSPRYARDNLPVDLAEPSLAETFGPLLWRDRVSLEEGELLYRDACRPDAEVLWVGHLDLDVRNHLESDTLAVDLSGSMKEPVNSGVFSLTGEVRGWRQARRVSELTVAVAVSFRDVDLKGLGAHLPGWRAADRLEGRLEGRVSYEGSLLLPGKGRVELGVEDPFFESDRVHTRAFRPSRLGLSAQVDARPDRLSLAEGELHLGDLAIKWGGEFELTEGKVGFLNLYLRGDDLPLVEAKQYMPLRLLHGRVWPFLVEMATGGRVDIRARLKGKPGDFSQMDTPAGQDALYLWLRFRDTTVVLPVSESYLPFHSTSGLLELDSGTLFFRDFRSAYGKSEIAEIQGTILGIHQARSHLQVTARSRLDLPEAVKELDHGIFPEALRKIARGVDGVLGSGSLTIEFNYAFGREADEVLHVSGQTSLREVAARVGGLKRGLRDLTGTLAFTEKALSAIDAGLKVGESPVRVQGRLSFGDEKKGVEGRLVLSSEGLQAGDLLALLDREEEMTGSLWSRAEVVWTEGAMRWSADVRAEGFQMVTRNHLYSGRALRLQAEGRDGSVGLRDLSVVVEDNAISASGQWTSLRPLVGEIRLRCPDLDLERLYRNKRTGLPWEKILELQPGPADTQRTKGLDLKTEVHLDRFRYKSVSLEDLDLKGEIRNGVFAVRQVNARAGGGQVALKGEFDLQGDRLPFSVLYSLSNLSAEEFFRWFSVRKELLQGLLFLEGSLRGELRPAGSMLETLAGSVSVFCGPCTVQRYEILSKLLSLVNFTQWARMKLSDLNARGVPCRQIKGNLRFENGYLQTGGLVIDSSIALAEVRGKYDLVRDGLDVDLSLKPTEPLDQVLDRLPVVGRVFPGPDGSVVGFQYRIEGPLQDPEVRLVPLKGLSDRMSEPLDRLNGVLRYLKKRVLR